MTVITASEHTGHVPVLESSGDRKSLSEPRDVLRLIAFVASLCALATWVVLFLPQGVGGRTAYIGVNGTSMTPTMSYGDMAVVRKASTYKVGDIVAYRIPAGEPGAGQKIIHRIVAGNGVTGFTTKGDHNRSVDNFWRPKAADIIGRVWFHIPRGMRYMIDLRKPPIFASLVGAGSFLLFVWPSTRRRKRRIN